METTALFRALGDPIRLEIVQRLASGKPYTITSVSEGFTISRQGVRKHLQILLDSEVIECESKGRKTFLHLNKKSLEHAKTYIAELEHRWDLRLKALKNYVEEAPILK